MPKVSKATASSHQQMPGTEMAWEDVDGWMVGFESDSADMDPAFAFKGLPNDQCQATHMGYVIKGRMGVHTAEGEEVFEAGDAYIVKPGHTPIMYAGAEVVDFTRTEEAREGMAVVMPNVQKYIEEHGMEPPS